VNCLKYIVMGRSSNVIQCPGLVGGDLDAPAEQADPLGYKYFLEVAPHQVKYDTLMIEFRGKMRNAFTIFVGKTAGKRPLGWPRHRGVIFT
jgi:hypothetical protein